MGRGVEVECGMSGGRQMSEEEGVTRMTRSA